MTLEGDGAARPPVPRLHLIVDPALCRERGIAPADLAARAVAGGRAVAVHLRGPATTAAALWQLATDLRAVIALPALLIVNDRADVAVAVGADGVHLGSQGLPLAAARRVMGPRFSIGRSVHSVVEARAAEREGADYALLGTIYPTASHPGVAGAGPALVRAVRAAVSLPIIAIGGIDEANLGEVLDAGADGAAVLRAIGAADDPAQVTAALYACAHGDSGATETLSDRVAHRHASGAPGPRGTPSPIAHREDMNGEDDR